MASLRDMRKERENSKNLILEKKQKRCENVHNLFKKTPRITGILIVCQHEI